MCKTLFTAASFGLALVACATTTSSLPGGPIIDVCVSDPAKQGFQCVDKKEQAYFLPYEKSENLVAFTSDDLARLISHYKISCRPAP